ncbi:MAG: general secretion pathway protein GspL [Geobacter sp.]|nr:general secretion pathway protein GspL [Geobacter sp.]
MNLLIIQLNEADAVVARFQRRRGILTFLQGSRRPLPDDGALAGLLDGFDPPQGEQKIILVLPPAMVYARELALPISDRRKVREILPVELGGETALQAEELVFDGIPLGEGITLALWCRRHEVAELLGRLAPLGLEPEIVTAGLLAWHHLIPTDTVGPVAVTDGQGLMVGTAAGPILARTLPAAGDDRELTRALTALEVSRDIRISRIIRHGRAGSAAEPSLSLASGLRETFAYDSAAALDLAGTYAVAKACTSGDCVNFRNGPLAYTAGQAKSRQRLRLTLLLAISLVILLFVEVGVRYYLLHKDVASLDGSVRKIYREIFPTRQKPVDAVAEVRSEIRRLSGGAAASRVLPTLRSLAELKGEEISGFYEVELDGTQVRLKGDARSAQAASALKGRAAALFDAPEVSEIKTKTTGGVSFTFRGTMKEANR